MRWQRAFSPETLFNSKQSKQKTQDGQAHCMLRPMHRSVPDLQCRSAAGAGCRIWELFKIMVLQDMSSDMVKGFPSHGLNECQRNLTETVSGSARTHNSSLERAPPPVLTYLLGRRGHFWRQSIHNLRQLGLSRFCFEQSQHRPGTQLSESTEEGLPGEGDYGHRCGSCNHRQAQGTSCGHNESLCVASLLRSCSGPTVLLCCPGASRQGFLLPACACTRGTRQSPVQENKAFVNSPSGCRLLVSAGKEVTAGT